MARALGAKLERVKASIPCGFRGERLIVLIRSPLPLSSRGGGDARLATVATARRFVQPRRRCQAEQVRGSPDVF